MTTNDAKSRRVEEDETTTFAERPDAAVGNYALEDLLSEIGTILRSEHPLPKRPHLQIVGSDAKPPLAPVQTTRLPDKS